MTYVCLVVGSLKSPTTIIRFKPIQIAILLLGRMFLSLNHPDQNRHRGKEIPYTLDLQGMLN